MNLEPLLGKFSPAQRAWIMGLAGAVATGVGGWAVFLNGLNAADTYVQRVPYPATVRTNLIPLVTNVVEIPIESSITIWQDGRYIRTKGVDRTGWSQKTVSGKNCDGLLYVGVKPQAPRKVEWFPVGRDYTGLKNALNPAESSYYQPDLKPGAPIRVEIRDVNGKLRNPAYAWEGVFK